MVKLWWHNVGKLFSSLPDKGHRLGQCSQRWILNHFLKYCHTWELLKEGFNPVNNIGEQRMMPARCLESSQMLSPSVEARSVELLTCWGPNLHDFSHVVMLWKCTVNKMVQVGTALLTDFLVNLTIIKNNIEHNKNIHFI